MIIKCEHAIEGKDSILRIWPAQDERAGAELANMVAEMELDLVLLADAENAKEEAESLANDMQQKRDELLEAIKEAIPLLRQINGKALKAEMISDAAEALEILEKALI